MYDFIFLGEGYGVWCLIKKINIYNNYQYELPFSKHLWLGLQDCEN